MSTQPALCKISSFLTVRLHTKSVSLQSPCVLHKGPLWPVACKHTCRKKCALTFWLYRFAERSTTLKPSWATSVPRKSLIILHLQTVHYTPVRAVGTNATFNIWCYSKLAHVAAVVRYPTSKAKWAQYGLKVGPERVCPQFPWWPCWLGILPPHALASSSTIC